MSDYNSSLPIRSEADVDQRVQTKIVDYTTPTQGATVDSSGRVYVKVNDALPAGSNNIGIVDANIRDGAGNLLTSQVNGAQRALDVGINVAGVQVDPRDIRALTSSDVVSANIRDNAGNAFSNSNPLPVTITSAGAGVETYNFNQGVAIAQNAASNHTLTVASGTTFFLSDIYAAASGKMKLEVQVGDGAVVETFSTIFVGFNSTAEANIFFSLENHNLPVVGTVNGTTIRLIRTNLDKAAQDLYSTIGGTLV